MEKHKYTILLFTNRDSDNVGDQIIEACDISLIATIMRNLDVDEKQYRIDSRALGIVNKQYLRTGNVELLQPVEKAIENSDIIVFGGAPIFNYNYQKFYEQTATILDFAQKHDVPVIFSAIGIEGYDEENDKCQRLKKAVNYKCVKQITTRDDFESLQKYIAREDIVIDKVSDPAVFTADVFKNYIYPKRKKKTIGIFVLRGNGFKDNGVEFSKLEAATLWKRLIEKLDKTDYDYELLTSGHFGDEAFLDYLIREWNINTQKCVFNINTPEQLVSKISSYDAVISTRLHPSIISFSLEIPSIGIVWNSKVKHFYSSVDYENRTLNIDGINEDVIIEKIDQILPGGVKKSNNYVYNVYVTLFNGIKNNLNGLDNGKEPYSYTKLIENIVEYEGTSEKELQAKLRRKFRRVYEAYNVLFEKKSAPPGLLFRIKRKAKKMLKVE